MTEIYGKISQEARKYLKDPKRFPDFCRMFLKILPTGGGKLVPFTLNTIQQFVYEHFILPDLLVGTPVRILCLKARQFGMSTLAEALGLWCTLGHANWNSIVVAHKGDKSREIFRMMKRFLQNLPQDGRLPRFAISRNSLGVIEFNVDPSANMSRVRNAYDIVLDSRIEVFSAQDRQDLGRSGTYQFAHLSEAAMWPCLSDSLASLLQACHDEPGTIVFVETTGNGYNDFYDVWSDESDSGSPTMWKRIFLPWYWYQNYERDHREIGKFAFTDEYEESLFDKIRSDTTLVELNGGTVPVDRIYDKLFWRRYVLKNRFRGDVDTFKQEFPSTPAEAFKFTGISAFPTGYIEKTYREKLPIWTGNIDIISQKAIEDGLLAKECIVSSEHPNGRFKIYEKPTENDTYLISTDIAEGRATEGLPSMSADAGEQRSKRDFTSFHIWKMSSFPPLEQVAVWHGNIEVDLLGYIEVVLGRMYNNAWICWETNMFGTAMSVIVVKRCKYKNVIMREVRDQFTDKILWEPGWETNRQTKPSMVAITKMFMREGFLCVHDPMTIAELNSFADLGGGKFGAVKGHDDRVMSLMQGVVVAEPRVDMEVRIKKAVNEERKKRKEGEYTEEMVVERFNKDSPYNPILGSDF